MKYACCILLLALLALTGCQQPAHSTPLPITFQRGQQLLAAGSPKSAIPFLTQTVASMPDGPEPLALLSLAYALDLQDQRAILEAHEVHRPIGAAPGWECVAVAIARMTQHQPASAVDDLRLVVSQAPDTTPIAPSARQWLALAQVLDAKPQEAIDTLQDLTRYPSLRSSATLWVALLQAQQGRTPAASAALQASAAMLATPSGRVAAQRNLADADDQTLYDAALANLAAGHSDEARRQFDAVQTRNPDAADTAVWLALLTAVRDWEAGRTQLKAACESSDPQSRGLANQLFGLVCAIEDRPDAMIDALLTGQRLLGRNGAVIYVVEQPKPDTVWFSDNMK